MRVQSQSSRRNNGKQIGIRTITDDYGNSLEVKLCPKCTRYHPATTDYFYTYTGKRGTRLLSSYCKDCQCALTRKRIQGNPTYYKKRYLQIQADPIKREAAKRYHKKWAAKERVEKPEQYRARGQRYYDAVMADPVRHARYRENERLRRHLKREREGRPILRHGHVKYVIPEANHRVPLEPFVDVLTMALEFHGGVRFELAARIGISDQHLGDILRRRHGTISLEDADKIAVALDLPLNSYLPDDLAA